MTTVGSVDWSFILRLSAHTHNKNIMEKKHNGARSNQSWRREGGSGLILYHYIFVKGSEKSWNPANLDMQLLLRVFLKSG